LNYDHFPFFRQLQKLFRPEYLGNIYKIGKKENNILNEKIKDYS